MKSLENRVKKEFIVTGCVLILVGILGAIFVEPLLLTPRHSTAYFWFLAQCAAFNSGYFGSGGCAGSCAFDCWDIYQNSKQ